MIIICGVIFANIKQSNWHFYTLPSTLTWPLCSVLVTWGLRYFRDRERPSQCTAGMYLLPSPGGGIFAEKVYHVKSLMVIINCPKTWSWIFLPAYLCFFPCPHPFISAISWHYVFGHIPCTGCVASGMKIHCTRTANIAKEWPVPKHPCSSALLGIIKLLTNVSWEHHHSIGRKLRGKQKENLLHWKDSDLFWSFEN